MLRRALTTPRPPSPARAKVHPTKGGARSVEAELALVLASPAWARIDWIVSLETQRVRDAEVTGGEVLEEHLAVADCSREDWERLSFLRERLRPEHAAPLESALAKAPRAGLVELLGWTARRSSDLATSARRAKLGPRLAPALDFARRRFVGEPAVARALAKTAGRFARTAGEKRWSREGELAWRALYVADTRASGQVVASLLEQTWRFTNDGPREQLAAAAAVRARSLREARACVAPLVAAAREGYLPEFAVSAAALAPENARRVLEPRWERYGEYGTLNIPVLVSLAGLLVVSPRERGYVEAARKMLPALLAKHRKDVGWDDVGLVSGLVQGIERGRIRELFPLLERVARWRFTGSVYDQYGAAQALLAGALVRRRAQRVLEGR